MEELRRERRVAFRYCDEQGRVNDAGNPNGAAENIAGIANREGNVVGLMPHPDRCSERLLGNDVGRRMFESVVHEFASR
jgi:phosphoribosylformylglycinamidine synthase